MMDHLTQTLNTLDIEFSEDQRKKIEDLILSGKIDLSTIKKLFIPRIPETLIDMSLDVMNEIEIKL